MKKTAVVVILLVVATQALAQDQLTGMFRMSQTPVEVAGEQMALALDDILPANEALRWQVYVPDTYDGTQPAGVLVFLDPNGWGGLPDQWRFVINDHNLIWVGPNQNERQPSAEKQVWHALLGLRSIETQYDVDLNRVYIGSSLPEKALISLNAQLVVNDFRGAIYMRGSVMWQDMDPDRLEMLRRKRHVFITGTNDPNKGQIRSDYESYKDAGINSVKLIFDTRHIGDLPDADHMTEAIRFLDDD